MIEAPDRLWVQEFSQLTDMVYAKGFSQPSIIGLNAPYVSAKPYSAAINRIAELEAALTLFIKYDAIASRPDEQHVDEYNHAIEAAKAAMKGKPND